MPDHTPLLPMLLVGATAGVFGGMFGIGGGLVIVPLLMLAFGYSLGAASGTSLFAQLFPVALLAVLTYHRRNEVAFAPGGVIAAGLVLGTFAGAWLAAFISDTLSPAAMKRFYALFLIAVGVYFLVTTRGK